MDFAGAGERVARILDVFDDFVGLLTACIMGLEYVWRLYTQKLMP